MGYISSQPVDNDATVSTGSDGWAAGNRVVPFAAVEIIRVCSVIKSANIFQQTCNQDACAGLTRRTVDQGQVPVVQIAPTLDRVAQGPDSLEVGGARVGARCLPLHIDNLVSKVGGDEGRYCFAAEERESTTGVRQPSPRMSASIEITQDSK